jgi:hypothetical protein
LLIASLTEPGIQTVKNSIIHIKPGQTTGNHPTNSGFIVELTFLDYSLWVGTDWSPTGKVARSRD